MSEKNISIKEADRKVFRTSFDDGLVDIFISSWVLMFVVVLFLSVYLGDFWSSAIFLPFLGAVYLILLWIRKNVIKPRAGGQVWSAAQKKDDAFHRYHAHAQRGLLYPGISSIRLSWRFGLDYYYCFRGDGVDQLHYGGIFPGCDSFLPVRSDAVRGILSG